MTILGSWHGEWALRGGQEWKVKIVVPVFAADARSGGRSMLARGWRALCALFVACSFQGRPAAAPHEPATPSEPPVADQVRWVGRVDLKDARAPRFSWSHSGFAVRFEGAALSAELLNEDAFLFRVVVDGRPWSRFEARRGRGWYELVRGLPLGVHTLEVIRESEGQYGVTSLYAIRAARVLAPPDARTRLVEVVGDSVAAGYGVLAEEHHVPERDDGCHYSYATQSVYEAYTGIAARMLDAELSVIAHSGWGVVRDIAHDPAANVPSLYDRVLADRPLPLWSSRRSADVVVIELGTNDFAGPPDSDPGEERFVAAYGDLLRRVRARHAGTWIVCVLGPLLTDTGRPDVKAASTHRAYVKRVIEDRKARGDMKVALVEFPHADLSVTGCDWHPSAAEHRKMAAVLVRRIAELTGWMVRGAP